MGADKRAGVDQHRDGAAVVGNATGGGHAQRSRRNHACIVECPDATTITDVQATRGARDRSGIAQRSDRSEMGDAGKTADQPAIAQHPDRAGATEENGGLHRRNRAGEIVVEAGHADRADIDRVASCGGVDHLAVVRQRAQHRTHRAVDGEGIGVGGDDRPRRGDRKICAWVHHGVPVHPDGGGTGYRAILG